MKWTKVRPKQEGFFWIRYHGICPGVVRVCKSGRAFMVMVDENAIPVSRLRTAEWSSEPIPEPGE